MQYSSKEQIANFIDETGMPNWENNIQILNFLDQINGIYDNTKAYNKLLKEYCELRIKSYNLIKKAILIEGSIYDNDIQQINTEIEGILQK